MMTELLTMREAVNATWGPPDPRPVGAGGSGIPEGVERARDQRGIILQLSLQRRRDEAKNATTAAAHLLCAAPTVCIFAEEVQERQRRS